MATRAVSKLKRWTVENQRATNFVAPTSTATQQNKGLMESQRGAAVVQARERLRGRQGPVGNSNHSQRASPK